MRRALIALLAVAAPLAAAGCGSDPVTMPDVTGMPLDEARDQLDALGLDVDANDASPEGRAVILDGNWHVVDQGVASGTTLEDGSTVGVEVLKDGESAGSAGTPASPSTASESERKAAAFGACKSAVREQLKAPATADFQSVVGAEFVITGSTVVVSAYVDSQNGFGAQIRSDWTCSAEVPSTGTATSATVISINSR